MSGRLQIQAVPYRKFKSYLELNSEHFIIPLRAIARVLMNGHKIWSSGPGSVKILQHSMTLCSVTVDVPTPPRQCHRLFPGWQRHALDTGNHPTLLSSLFSTTNKQLFSMFVFDFPEFPFVIHRAPTNFDSKYLAIITSKRI